MIGAFAEAAKVLGDVSYRTAAERAVGFMRDKLVREGRLLRTWTAGEAKLDAYLDDYAFLVNALLDLYEATADPTLVEDARKLGTAILERFEDHEELVHRPKPLFDGSIPSGNSSAVQGLLRLFHFVGDERFLASAERALSAFATGMAKNPFGFANMIGVADFYLRKPREIVIVGVPADAATSALVGRVHTAYVPNKTMVLVDPARAARLPVAEGKIQIDGRVTAYVCHDYTCSTPVTSWSELEPLLQPARG
jgi:uncharacterized protein YyaL (SSP411 family)